MPFLVMRRTDIPDGVLQVLDLQPNESQRNLIYQPPGQSVYIQNIPTQDVVATTDTGPVNTNTEYGGLAAYLIDNVEEGGPEPGALTAAVANAAATAIAAQAISGGEGLTLADIGGLLVGAGAPGGTTLTGGESTATLEELLSLLSGRNYVLPAGSEVETTGDAFVSTRHGEFTESFRRIRDTESFRMSVGEGHLAEMMSSDFIYEGVAGTAVEAFEDDGTRI
jgi:hypothetical protein